jgi:O-antigen/teichoic acid export membrane protein
MKVSDRLAAMGQRHWRQALTWLSETSGIDPRLLLHSSFLLGATVLGQALSFAVQMLVARRIGTGAYGIYSYAFAWINLLALIALMGSDRLVIRYGSEYEAKAEYALLYGLLRRSFVWSLAVSGLLMVAFALASLALMAPSPERFGVAFWSALALPLLVAGTLTESMLRVLGAHGWASLPNRLLRPFVMGGLFLLLSVLLTSQPDARWAIAANTIALLVVMLVSVGALRLRLPPRPLRRIAPPGRAWLTTSVAFGVNALALWLNVQLGILVLGAFQNEQVVGTYGAVSRLVDVASFAIVAVVTIVQPMIVQSFAGATRGETQRLVADGSRLIVATNFCLVLLILLFAEPLLAMFGPGFEAGATALRVLALGSMVASIVSLSGALLGMTGYEKQATMVMAGGCCLTLALNVLLAPRFGATGTAIATTISTIAWNLALFVLAQVKLGITAAPVALPHGMWARR